MSQQSGSRHTFETRVLGRLREIFDRHPWLITTEYVQGSVALAANVRELTDQPVMAVGAAQGAGELEPDLPFEVLPLGMPPGESMVDTMHRGQELLADPDPSHQAAVDSWDPAGAARSIASFTSVVGQPMGRLTFGSRPESWRELEDKLVIESIWATAGIPVAPSRQVEMSDRTAVLAAHVELASSSGTVWAGDNSSGWHGGGAGTFWVPDLAAAGRLCDELDRFDRIRVMPFVEGVPSSMHGMVVPDGTGGSEVITFRPCEMLVLRERSEHKLVYCRSATFWDPDPADRQAMVSATKRIGTELVDRVGYRGIFTVDGVVGRQGFVPTEVNTRYGAALRSRHPTETGEALELVLLNMAVIEGLFDDVDLRPLESIVTDALDEERNGRTFITCSARPEEARTAAITRAADGRLLFSEGSSEEPEVDSSDANAVVANLRWATMGPDAAVVNVVFEEPPVGPSVAPLLVEIIELANQQWSLGISTLEPASSVR